VLAVASSAQSDRLVAQLAAAGCVAAREEAEELMEAASGSVDLLDSMVARRVSGEPLAWVTGSTLFAGIRVRVDTGVYVPRWQTEPLARRAAHLLPDDGIAVDLCTGSGAIACVLSAASPQARVLASDIDWRACQCAAANGVEVLLGDLDDPLPLELMGHVDVVTAVPPYVPSGSIAYLPSDARDHEPPHSLDGGPDGTRVLGRVVAAAARLLRPGGTLLVELGADQDLALAERLTAAGFSTPVDLRDEDDDLRGLEAMLASTRAT
jgi:release factor glutamine methyltransferase